MADFLPLILSLISVVGAAILLVSRVRLNGLHNNARRRYLLIDTLILLACAEIAADAVADLCHISTSCAPGMYEFFSWAALIGRGMVTAGVLALLISFPFHKPRCEQERRRHDD